MAHRLTRTAEDQFDALLLDSARDHGLEAAGRYGQLILSVMAALGEEPYLIGSLDVPRCRVFVPTRPASPGNASSRNVASPALVTYRLAADGKVEILGLAHDRMVLSRAAQRIVRTADQNRKP